MSKLYTEDELERVFGKIKSAPDPLLAAVKIAVEKDIDPRAAIYYFKSRNLKGSFAFNMGLKSSREFFSALTKNKDYINKHAVATFEYLSELSGA